MCRNYGRPKIPSPPKKSEISHTVPIGVPDAETIPNWLFILIITVGILVVCFS